MWSATSAFPDVQWQAYDWFLRPTVPLTAIHRASSIWSRPSGRGRVVARRCGRRRHDLRTRDVR